MQQYARYARYAPRPMTQVTCLPGSDLKSHANDPFGYEPQADVEVASAPADPLVDLIDGD